MKWLFYVKLKMLNLFNKILRIPLYITEILGVFLFILTPICQLAIKFSVVLSFILLFFIILPTLDLYFSYVISWYQNKINPHENMDFHELGNLGLLGDSIGGILNPLIAGVALYVLTKTLKMQQKEFKQVKQSMEKQSNQIDRQNFESLFFQLINMKNKVLEDLRVDDSLNSIVNNSNSIFKTDIEEIKKLNEKKAELEEQKIDMLYFIEEAQKQKNAKTIKFEQRTLYEFIRRYSYQYSYFKTFDTNNLEMNIHSDFTFYLIESDSNFFIELLKIIDCLTKTIAATETEIQSLKDKKEFFEAKLADYLEKLSNPHNLPTNEKLILVIGIFEYCHSKDWSYYWSNYVKHFMQAYLNIHFQILLLIDSLHILEDDLDAKIKYANIYKSQLTNHEMKFLYWNSHYVNNDNFELARFIKKFSICETLTFQGTHPHSYHYHLHRNQLPQNTKN